MQPLNLPGVQYPDPPPFDPEGFEGYMGSEQHETFTRHYFDTVEHMQKFANSWQEKLDGVE